MKKNRSRDLLAFGFITIFVYHGLITVMRLAAFTLAKWTVVGGEHIPQNSGCVLVSNHVHIVDPPLVAASSRVRRLRTMAKQELFDIPLIGWLFGAYGAYPVSRSGRDTRAMRKSLRLLEEGEAVLLFAEGTRSSGGPLQPAHRGAALIALRSGQPVIPVSISGSNINLPGIFYQWALGRRPRIQVQFGNPVDLSDISADIGGASEATDRIMRRIAAMLPESLQGPYAGPRAAGSSPVVAGDRLN
jgi:1-acyl-sn-glycerol-3-phosphate acyltransferase